MGKKKKDKHSQMDWRRGLESAFYGPTGGKATKALERYGLDRRDYASEGAIGQGRVHGKGSYKDMEEELLRRASTDYDTRRALEASAMAGNKKAEKFAKNGIGNIKDLMRVQSLQKKQHKKMGNGGDFSSASDFAGLSYGMVKKDRDAQTAAYDKQYASQDMLNKKMDELKDKFKTMEESDKAAPEIVESEELKAARARLAGNDPSSSSDSLYKTGTPRPEPTTAFRKENEGAPATDDRKKAVGSYLEQYKKDVIAGGRIGEATTNNLNNAYNTVIRSDI